MNTQENKKNHKPQVYVKPRLLQVGNTDSIKGDRGGGSDGYSGYYSDRTG